MDKVEEKKPCSHFRNIKSEKLFNILVKKNLTVCENKVKEHSSQDLYLCLECGQIFCSHTSDPPCFTTHYENTGHSISINLKNYMVYCHHCQDDLESQVEIEELSDEKPQLVEKMTKFVENSKQLIFNLQKQQKRQLNLQKEETKKESEKSKKTSDMGNTKSKFQENKNKPVDVIPNYIFGLRNLGNTCFFNSVMQCINGTTELTRIYLELDDDKIYQNVKNFQSEDTNNYHQENEEEQKNQYQYDNSQYEFKVAYDKKNKQRNKKTQATKSYRPPQFQINQHFSQFLRESRSNKNQTVDPEKILRSVQMNYARFRTMQQQDAQELLICLLDTLSVGEERWLVNQSMKKQDKLRGKQKRTYVEQLFGGYLCNYLKCKSCDYYSRTFDFYLDLIIQIPGFRKVVFDQDKPKSKSQKKSEKKKVLRQIKLGERKKKQEEEQKEVQEKLEHMNLTQEKQVEKQDENQAKKQVEDENNAKQIEQPSKQETQDQNEEKEKEKEKSQTQEGQCEEVDQDSKYNLIVDEELKDQLVPNYDQEEDELYEPTFQIESVTKKSDISLKDCLDDFASFEILDESSEYKCEKCQKQSTLRKFFLYDPPQVLTIVIKRFIQRASSVSKITVRVSFEEFINIDNYTILKFKKNEFNQDQEKILAGEKNLYNYELYGVVVHSGTISGGHYISYVKHIVQGDKRWFYYSDSHVKEVSFKNVQMSEAYLLFYRRIESGENMEKN